MGAILAILRGDGGGDDAPIDVPVDLEGARPTQEEAQIFHYVSDILGPAQYHLEILRNYNGCGDAIRKAISSPSRESEEAAWAVVSPAVIKLKDYYEFSLRLGDAFPRLLQFFCNGEVASNLERFQATARKMGDIFHFVSVFDELKMGNPNVQNDFSYYRRTLSRMRMTNGSPQYNIVVHDELANRMSLFYAHSTPMLKAMVDSAQNAVKGLGNGVNADTVTDTLAILAAICYNAIAKGRAQGLMVDYCLRVLVVCIVVYDHVSPVGVFIKGSKINVRASVKVIQQHSGQKCTGFLNSIRYATLHLNDETTPKNVKQILAA
ncbi:Protein fam49a [Chytridiales sp. JEL 0842]|nr:Protein fam49a [Chytridiales sp. JEL 0842]